MLLQDIGFTKKLLTSLQGIVVDPQMKHYKNNPHTKDSKTINWAKDEFVPPLTSQELETYINNPSRFRQDLLDNLQLYLKFCTEMAHTFPKVKRLKLQDKIIALLTFHFLFQSAMDYHYYKYDYLLDLEEYSKSPLGWHYLRVEKIISQVSSKLGREKSWVSEKVLRLLSKNGLQVVKELKVYLNESRFDDLRESFEALQIYQKVQQEENILFMGRNMDSQVFKTGFEMWKMLGQAVKISPNEFFKNKKTLIKILNGNPIIGTRKILANMAKYFNPEIVQLVKKNVLLWNASKP